MVIGVIGLLLFTAGIGQQPFINFEARFAVFAQEMLRHGLSLFPTTYGEPYPDYPATSTVFIYALALLFGGVSKLIAVLPTAIAAATTLALSYRLLAPVSRTWALLTVCMQLLTATFLAEARSISIDQMIAAITVASFFCAYTADFEQCPQRRRWLPLLLVIGFTIRGPLGVVLPTGVVCSYYLLSRQWRALLGYGIASVIVLSVCWGALLWLARNAGGDTFMHDVIRMQVSGRMEPHGVEGPLYYFTSSFGNYALAFPLAFLVLLAAFPQRGQQPNARLLLFLSGWVLIILIGLSIPHTKKIRYLLPMVPAIAAIAAYPFVDQSNRLLIWLRKGIDSVLLILPAVASVGLWALKGFVQKHQLLLPVSLLVLTAILLTIQLLVIGCALKLHPIDRRSIAAALGAVATVWVAQVLLVEPAQLQLHDTQKFVRQVEQLRQQQPAPLAFFNVGKDAAAIKYLVNVDYDLQPDFYFSANELAKKVPPFYLVMDDKQRAALHDSRIDGLAPVASGHFDKDTYTVFFVPAP